MGLTDRKGVPLELGQDVIVDFPGLLEGKITDLCSLVTASLRHPGKPVRRVIVTVPVLLEIPAEGGSGIGQLVVTAGQSPRPDMPAEQEKKPTLVS